MACNASLVGFNATFDFYCSFVIILYVHMHPELTAMVTILAILRQTYGRRNNFLHHSAPKIITEFSSRLSKSRSTPQRLWSHDSRRSRSPQCREI